MRKHIAILVLALVQCTIQSEKPALVTGLPSQYVLEYGGYRYDTGYVYLEGENREIVLPSGIQAGMGFSASSSLMNKTAGVRSGVEAFIQLLEYHNELKYYLNERYPCDAVINFDNSSAKEIKSETDEDGNERKVFQDKNGDRKEVTYYGEEAHFQHEENAYTYNETTGNYKKESKTISGSGTILGESSTTVPPGKVPDDLRNKKREPKSPTSPADFSDEIELEPGWVWPCGPDGYDWSMIERYPLYAKSAPEYPWWGMSYIDVTGIYLLDALGVNVQAYGDTIELIETFVFDYERIEMKDGSNPPGPAMSFFQKYQLFHI